MPRPLPSVSYRIDPFDLKLFACVADAGSITAGAARMHLSLAAASVRLQQLEHAFGVAMLRRSKRGVTVPLERTECSAFKSTSQMSTVSSFESASAAMPSRANAKSDGVSTAA